MRLRRFRWEQRLLWVSITGLLHLCAIPCQAVTDSGRTIFGDTSSTSVFENSDGTSMSKARVVIPRVLYTEQEVIDGVADNHYDDWTAQYETLTSPLPSIGSSLERHILPPEPERAFQRRRRTQSDNTERQPVSFLSSTTAIVSPVSLLLEEYDPDGDSTNDVTTAAAGSWSSSTQTMLLSHTKKTGTTIAGCALRNGHVILGADTRATEGTMVADKECSKIHQLATNVWCCGAGTSGDLDKLTRNVLYTKSLECLSERTIGNGEDVWDVEKEGHDRRQDSTTHSAISDNYPGLLEILYQEGYNDQNSVHGDALIFMGAVPIDALCIMFQNTLFENQGNLGANLVLGGVWNGRAYLRAIHPHGSVDVNLPFAALGSGGLAALGILEDGYRPDLTLEEGVSLVQRAILSGIRNDLGSGSQVDLCIIYPNGTSRHTRCVVPEEILKDVHVQTKSVEMSFEEDGSAGTGNNSVMSRRPNLGVNGFGNMPFAIESTKQRVVNIKTNEERRKMEWNKILGIPGEEEHSSPLDTQSPTT